MKQSIKDLRFLAETKADAEETLPDWEKRLRREIEESHPDRTLTDFMKQKMRENRRRSDGSLAER